MHPAPVKCTETESYWRAHLARQERSGLTVREYCLREGFSQASLYNWRKRLRTSPGQPSPVVADAPFLELTHLFAPPSAAAAPRWEMELTLPGGAVVRLARGFDPESLRRAVEVLVRC